MTRKSEMARKTPGGMIDTPMGRITDPNPPSRESARERDERIVAEAGPWTVADSSDGIPTLQPFDLAVAGEDADQELIDKAMPAMQALNCIAWRLTRARRAARKGGK